MSAALATFFDVMSTFLDGSIGAREVETRIGACPSGAQRLGFYRRLVRGDLHRLLTDLFPSLEVALEHVAPGRFEELADAYLRAHPPTDWDPARAGEHLSDFLGEARMRGEPYPAYCEELADFYETRRRAADDPSSEGTLDKTVFVRRYAFAVPDYALAVDRGASDGAEPPAEAPTIVVIFRSALDQRAHVMSPSLAALLVLAGADALAMFPEVTSVELDGARGELVLAGVLPEESKGTQA